MRISASLALIALLACPVQARDLTYPGAIGADDREMVDATEHPWPAIGKVVVDGLSLRLFCTGVLVKPDTVITAAHCLFNQRTGKYTSADRVSFIAGARRDRNAGHSRAKCARVLDPSADYRHFGLATAARDVAILTLAKPLSVKPLTMVKGPLTIGESVSHAGYGRNRPHLPSVHRDCAIIKATQSILMTSCDTNLGQSGGPLLVQTDGDWQLAAIMIGVIEHEASVAVPASVWRKLVPDRTCKD